MNLAVRRACLVVALLGCAKPASASREILTDLARWDAATSAARRAAAEDVARRLPDFALLRLETFSCGGQTHEVAIYRHAKTGLEFALLPAGDFEMSSPEGEPGRPVGEAPQHRVLLTKVMLLARTECTQAAYRAAMGASVSQWSGDDLPVDRVSWADANAFCTRADLRLPTEAEWERACRAGSNGRWCFGDDQEQLGDYAWCNSNSGQQTHAVGRKKPNALGLFDTHGNVWEYCADWYGPSPVESATDPTGPAAGERRVSRGGAWDSAASSTRAARRTSVDANDRQDRDGFRPAKTVPMD